MTHKVSRAVHFPQSFPKGAFAPEGLLNFMPSDRESKDADFYAVSVVCRCVMPSDGKVHEYGQKIAEKQNAAFFDREGHAPPEEKKRTYLAYYDLAYAKLREVVLDFYKIAVRAIPEDGEIAHLEIHFVRNEVESDSPKRRRADRGAAISAIMDRLVGPYTLPVDASEKELRARQAELPVLR